MKVADLMCRPVASTTEETSVANAARRMEESDCGVLPVLRNGTIVGIVTDRDICLSLGRLTRHPKDILVREIMTRDVGLCRTDDDVHDALATMARRQVRRLPVTDAGGRLEGILSADDVVLRAEERDPSRVPALSCRDALETLRAIYGSRHVRVATTS